ncbi:hypothetical protein KVV02_000666 [Mortierella alpina]|uniref:FAD-binding domain-containing protein n=1 Tax=Mortierella alpina TaxID=64518 RepID=A0A9P8D0H8_MORAP|nr:hypothetical protein KVV02_000666 [Mortierella alpina]
MSVEEGYKPASPPRVIIVGAGISGVFLGILLERANIPYEIYERATSVKQLGGVGYDYVVFSRPRLYDMLLSHLPASKVHFGKKVLSVKHPEEGGVLITCSDNSSYLGDILVGADGAYSAVRQSLYRQLSEKDSLPVKDSQGLKIGYMTMVGTTDPLDDAKYEQLQDDFTHFSFIIGKGKPYTTWGERLLRHIVFGYLPQSMLHKDTVKAASYRPQCNYLPLTPNHGTCSVLPQKPSKRYQEEQEKATVGQK